MRKLASVQKISKLEAHPNADTLEIAKVLGWSCIVKKREFKENDLCVYAEIDSVFPDKPEFEFLRRVKFRIRTIKLRGVVSQGLVLPLSCLPKGDYQEGLDVTELLGITQYIFPIPAHVAGEIKGQFPIQITPKTDEPRVQTIPSVLARHKGLECYITEKIDGASVTYYYKDGNFGVCSRNLELKETENNAFWKWARENDIENKLNSFGKNISIQGELFGQGIQKNPLRMPERHVKFFNVFFTDGYRYANFAELKETLSALGLEIVPVISESFSLIDDINELSKLADGYSLINPKKRREGIVIRPKEEKFDYQMAQGFGNGRLSFKVVSTGYLLETGE